jgi:gluconate 2-dehydrogenase gamma chain
MWELVKPDTRFFTADQRKQVEALFEAILPGTDTSPGATDVNAAEYLDTLLAMDHETYYAVPQMKQMYPVGLLVVEDAGRRMFGGRGIVALTLDERTQLLEKLAAGKIEGTSYSAKDQIAFFTDLRIRCIEGCFGDARWGGNKDNAMWRWYGWTVPAEEFKRDQPQQAIAPPMNIKELAPPKRSQAQAKPKSRRPRP